MQDLSYPSCKLNVAMVHRLVVVAVLTAAVLLLGYLWMSLTTFTYAKIHLFILTPLIFLYTVPPRPLSDAKPEIRQSGYWLMPVLAVIAVVYSVAGWDRILYETGVITCSTSYGSLFSVPYEEWFWCVDHSVLVSLWVMSIWHSRPVPRKRGNSCVVFRVVSALVCVAMAIFGYILLSQAGKNFTYLGLSFLHTFPIIALHFAAVGHFYLQYLREYFLGLVIPTVYVLAIDTLAISKGVWGVNDEFTTGRYVFGMRIEHVVIYVLTTALASQTIIGFLRCAEVYHTVQKREKLGALSMKSMAVIISHLWG